MVLAAGILRRQVKKKKERDGQPVSQKDGVSIKKENRIIFQLAGQKVTKKNSISKNISACIFSHK